MPSSSSHCVETLPASLSQNPRSQRQLRRAIRQRRRALSKSQQAEAASRVFRQLRRHPWFRYSKRIAFYLASPAEGEIDLKKVIKHAQGLGKQCYLPVMRRDGPDRLMFARYKRGDQLRRGRYGILQPSVKRRGRVPANALNLVLMPLVAFDPEGNRMGMGKGFYDRTFAFKRGNSPRNPRLLGVAHECQRVEKLESAAWDVPLDAIATPEGVFIFQRS